MGFRQRYKAALWYSIGKMVDRDTLADGTNATPQFIGALMELVWAQIGTRAPYPGPSHASISRLMRSPRGQRTCRRIWNRSRSESHAGM